MISWSEELTDVRGRVPSLLLRIDKLVQLIARQHMHHPVVDSTRRVGRYAGAGEPKRGGTSGRMIDLQY